MFRSVVRRAQEHKRAAPFRKRLLNETRPVSPSYAVEGASWGSIWTQLKDCAFSDAVMARPRDVRRPSRPPVCRTGRQLFA
jgi:hypothetical protein